MNTKKLVRCALLTACAMILSYLESMLPLSIGIPGVKLGLANLVVLVALYRIGTSHAWIISLIRVFLTALLFGSAVTLAYSLAGAVLSLAGSCLLKRTDRFSQTGVSVAGAVLHNLGQLAMAAVLMNSNVLAAYLPVLVASGIVTGILIGLLAGLLIQKLPIPKD